MAALRTPAKTTVWRARPNEDGQVAHPGLTVDVGLPAMDPGIIFDVSLYVSGWETMRKSMAAMIMVISADESFIIVIIMQQKNVCKLCSLRAQ